LETSYTLIIEHKLYLTPDSRDSSKLGKFITRQ